MHPFENANVPSLQIMNLNWSNTAPDLISPSSKGIVFNVRGASLPIVQVNAAAMWCRRLAMLSPASRSRLLCLLSTAFLTSATSRLLSYLPPCCTTSKLSLKNLTFLSKKIIASAFHFRPLGEHVPLQIDDFSNQFVFCRFQFVFLLTFPSTESPPLPIGNT